MTDITDLFNLEKDQFVKEVFELAQTEEVKKLADQTIEHYKNHPEKQVLELKEQDIMRVLKVSYIAERFFGRSRSWLTHKLNHDIVNGKRSDLTKEEREKLKDALDTIAWEIQILSDNL